MNGRGGKITTIFVGLKNVMEFKNGTGFFVLIPQRLGYDLKEPSPIMIIPICVIDKYSTVHLEVGVSPSVLNKC